MGGCTSSLLIAPVFSVKEEMSSAKNENGGRGPEVREQERKQCDCSAAHRAS